MKKSKWIWWFCVLILFGILVYYLSSYYMVYLMEKEEKMAIHTLENRKIQIETKTDKSANLNYQYSLSSEKIYDNTEYEKDKPKEPSNIQSEKWKGDSILFIPDIELEKVVYTGKNRESHLQNYELVTASDDMKYENGGNYIICGHASKLYGHSLNRIKEVKEGTVIQIKTKDTTDEYVVNRVIYPNMNQTSEYCNQTTENTITIISCAKYVSKESYIVIQAERKD